MIDATLLDRLMFCVQPTIEPIIQLELGFAHRLDLDRLRRAMTLVLEADPILACRFVPHPRAPHWSPCEAEPASLVRVHDAEAYERAKSEPLDCTLGPQVRADLCRGPSGDWLTIGVHHVASDAGGVKRVGARLAATYRALAQDPTHRPARVSPARGMRAVTREVPWRALPRILHDFVGEQRRLARPAHTLPLEPTPRTRARFALLHFDRARVARLKLHGRRFGATIQDLFVAAHLRAIADAGWDGRSALRLATTVDLRRYLRDAGALGAANLSTLETVSLGTELGARFDDTLAHVARESGARKRGWIGLPSWIGLGPLLSLLPFRTLQRFVHGVIDEGLRRRTANDGLTNLGPLAPEDLAFDAPPRDAWMLVPPTVAPMLTTGVSGYDGTLTLSAGIYPEAWRRLTITDLFAAIDRELPA